jgi:DNA-directed RNA polymerase specialized sigma24 family protein
MVERNGTPKMSEQMLRSTDPKLLERVAALLDNPAWFEFFQRYDPLLRSWCSAYGFDAALVDELRQRIWVELARRMPSYQYDPQGSFRGWLRRLCHHRAINLYHECRDNRCFSLGEDDLIDARWTAAGELDQYDEFAPGGSRLLEEALEVQMAVQRKVKPSRWEAFWRVVIEGESMSEVAAALGLKYATAYAGVNHVARLLRQEGRRRRAGLGLADESDS